MSKKVEIYTKPTCGFCHRAIALLKQKNVSFEEISLAKEPERRQEMIGRAGGGYTVPQIFIAGEHIGGSDELAALERKGQLDGLLAALR